MLFLMQMRLSARNEKLKMELGRAEKALAFDKPTESEAQAVKHAFRSQHGRLDEVEVAFEALEFHERIGAGAFGEVIRGEYCGTAVAIKRLLRSRINEENVRAVGEEVQLLRRLRHPNIVQFVGASWDNVANICIVFELVERGSLFDLLKDTSLKLTWEDPKLRMLIDVVSGLVYLHGASPPIIHRDVKTDNVLVTNTFLCKLTDFGASRVAADDVTMTTVGTPQYTAPEVYAGDYYSQSADVYSLSLLMLELHTTERPYPPGMSAAMIQTKVLRGNRPQPPHDMPLSLREIMVSCWSHLPSDRPSSAQVLKALQQVAVESISGGPMAAVGQLSAPPMSPRHDGMHQPPPPITARSTTVISTHPITPLRSGGIQHFNSDNCGGGDRDQLVVVIEHPQSQQSPSGSVESLATSCAPSLAAC